jgi:hypothetical protein
MTDYTTDGKHIMLSIDEDPEDYELEGDFQWTCPCCAEVVNEHHCDDEEDCEKCQEDNAPGMPRILPMAHAPFGCCWCKMCGAQDPCCSMEYSEKEGRYICSQCFSLEKYFREREGEATNGDEDE